MLKEIDVGISVNYFNDTKCLDFSYNQYDKYTCYYDYDVNICCNTLFKDFYGNLDNETLVKNKCYNYNNKTFDLTCDIVNEKFNLFVYFMFILFILSLILVIILIVNCLIIKRRQKYYRIRNSRSFVIQRNPLYEAN